MIEQIPFFQGLDAEDLAKLEAISVVKKYKKGETYYEKTHICKSIYR